MNPERQPERVKTPESSHELQDLAQERLEALRNTPEEGERDQADKVEQAREAIEKHAEQPPVHTGEKAPTQTNAHRNPFTNYTHTMTSLRKRLSPASRRFSDVIHSPAVERASEVMERTVMRPSVTLGATSTALLVGTILYIMARRYGFSLSGSEILIAIVVGGIFGAITELLFKPFGRRQR